MVGLFSMGLFVKTLRSESIKFVDDSCRFGVRFASFNGCPALAEQVALNHIALGTKNSTLEGKIPSDEGKNWYHHLGSVEVNQWRTDLVTRTEE